MESNTESLVYQLRKQKDDAELLVSKVLFPILITSKKTRKIIYANPYAQKQYETTLETLIGMEVSEFYVDDSQREKIIENLKSDGTVENLEMSFKTLKGNKFLGLLSVTNLTFRDEECFMGMVKDITLQREQEQKLSIQSKNEALGELVGNIAHQWRQPLNTISIHTTGILLQKELGILEDEELEISLKNIQKHIEFLSTTINTFRNIITQENEISKEHFSVNKILHDILNNNYTFVKNINFSKEVELYESKEKFKDVILSILQNSEDSYTRQNIDKDKRIVDISLVEINGEAIIKIIDNAGGIDDSIINKIFEPYFTTEHQSQGKGLGLFNVHKTITESFKGKCECSSYDNKASILIKIPIKFNIF